jgi:hypothetical protein
LGEEPSSPEIKLKYLKEKEIKDKHGIITD